MQTLNNRLKQATNELVRVLDSVTDDASATAAAPEIRRLGVELPSAMNELKLAVATLSLGGQRKQVDDFYREQMTTESERPDPLAKLERVVNSDQGPLLRNEINGLLDGMLAAAVSGDRRQLERIIEQKKLRR